MSVLIKGMDMPEKCAWCPFCMDETNNIQTNEYYCNALDDAPIIENIFEDKRPQFCPLYEARVQETTLGGES